MARERISEEGSRAGRRRRRPVLDFGFCLFLSDEDGVDDIFVCLTCFSF